MAAYGLLVCCMVLGHVDRARADSTPSLQFLHSFATSEGFYPVGGVVQGDDGNFYGTTLIDSSGLSNGTVFQLTPSGTLTTLHSLSSDGSEGTNINTSLVQGSDGDFYGTAVAGGTAGYGTVFKITPTGTFTALYSFDFTNGASPYAALVQGSDGNFYGTTSAGGASGNGTVFKITPSGALTTLYSFDSTNGATSYAGLVLGNDGNFYGTTSAGGASGNGTIFKITPSGALTTLYSFDFTNGASSYAALMQASDGDFYGTTAAGGANGGGTVFKITSAGALTTLYSFNSTSGTSSSATLVQATDGTFYGTTYLGGAGGTGALFEMTPSGTLTVLYSAADFAYPRAGVVLGSDGNLYGTIFQGGDFGLGAVYVYDLVASTTPPSAPILSATPGDASVTLSWAAVSGATSYSVYQGTSAGGEGTTPIASSVTGTSYTVSGLTNGVTYYFTLTATGSGGTSPSSNEVSAIPALVPPAAPVISATAGDASVTLNWSAVNGATSYAVYQAASAGGEGTTPIAGNVTDTSYTISGLIDGNTYYFTLTATGAGGTSVPSNEVSVVPMPQDLTYVYRFTGTFNNGQGTYPYGAYPYGGVVQASDGNLYGTTTVGGANGSGTVFKVTPTGTLTTLHDFVGDTEGSTPNATLVLGSDGNFYGTNSAGAGTTGCGSCGSVFKITSSGTLTILHKFGYQSDGGYPLGALVQGRDGNFYGTTSGGGTSGAGSVFQITPSGVFTTLHMFSPSTGEGGYPYSGLVQGSDGDFYGTTHDGGVSGYGTVFKITASGVFTTLHLFDSVNGSHPYAALAQGSDGDFYGTTFDGGVTTYGTVFKITPSGAFALLHTFFGANFSDGKNPYYGALMQGGDGNFYGTTSSGGTGNNGAVFQITSSGTLTTLYSFANPEAPLAGLVEGADGNLYGTTRGGGNNYGYGSVFAFHAALPPAAPALSATPSDASVSLSWGASNGATSYNVYLGTSPGGEAATPIASGVTGTGYVVSGLTNGTTYYFTLTATGSNGTGAASNEASATPGGSILPPDAPVLGATSGNGLVTLNWSAVSGANNYAVYMGTSPGGEGSTPVAGSITGTGYVVSGLSNGTTYYFTLTATGAGGTSAASNEVSATPESPVAPAAPVLSGAPGNASAILSWGPVTTATSYSVYFGTSPGGEESTPVITITTTGLTLSQLPDGRRLVNGTTYYFEVTANGDGGSSPRSNEVSVTPATPPPTVDGDYVYTQGDVFGSDNPRSTLLQGKDGNYYGITSYGGSHGAGTFYRLTPDGVKTVLYDFGGYCQPNDTLCRDGLPLYGWLTQDADGNFYGVESGVTGFNTASATSFGWVYKMTPAGQMTKIYEDLTGTALPGDGVVLGQDGNFYGITYLTDQYGLPAPLVGGGIYQLTLSGQYSIVFDWATYAEHVNGDTRPGGKLTEAYGYWWASIASDGIGNYSGILKLDLNAGEAQVFPCSPGNGFGTATDGVCANPGHLVPGPDDTLYAACTGCNWLQLQLSDGEFVDVFPGGVFQITVDGTVTLVHGFTLDGNGAGPYEDLVRASDGNFYGSTNTTFFPDASVNLEARIYRISPEGDISNVIENLSLAPGVAMMQGSDGKLHGVNQSSAFALWNPGLLSSYLASPIVVQDFEPATIPQGEVSTLTITLGNSGSSAAILSEPLIDRLPDSVTVAQVPNASTTCTHGSVVADAGSNTITLATSSQIPAGTCTVSVSVTGATAGSHINTIPAWAVQTDLGGNVEPALAALTVTPVADVIFADGFDG